MKAIQLCALACTSAVLAGCPQHRPAAAGEAAALNSAAVEVAMPTLPSSLGSSDVTLTLDTLPVTTQTTQGERFGITMVGTWQKSVTSAVYLQVSDSAGTLVAPAPILAPKRSTYQIELPLPTSTPVGVYIGMLSVRACADSLCTQPYPGTTQSIGYKLQVNALGEWETLQRNSRHDGYVPVQIDPTRYQRAWSWQSDAIPTEQTDGKISAVVTDGNNVYFSDPRSNLPSVYAKAEIDGAYRWRLFPNSNTGTPEPAPPTVSGGVVYIATTGQGGPPPNSPDATWVSAYQPSDGAYLYRAQISTPAGAILNPTVRNGKVFVNAGIDVGVMYAFNIADGAAAWNASGGTNGMNTPAADDDYVYASNGGTLAVFNTRDGSVSARIGPDTAGVQADYYGTPMLGSADHVLAYSGTSTSAEPKRQLIDYSVASQTVRWMSNALYSNFPAVAKGVVYATSNTSYSLDALDEATGRVLWSWKPLEQSYNFIGNVVVTDNVVFVSTQSRIYAISLVSHRAIWSAATPGTISISANRMLFVSAPYNPAAPVGRITAYRLE